MQHNIMEHSTGTGTIRLSHEQSMVHYVGHRKNWHDAILNVDTKILTFRFKIFSGGTVEH